MLFSLLSEHYVSRASHSQCYLACCQNTMYQGSPTPSVIQLVVRTPCIKGLPLLVLFSVLSEHHVLRASHTQCYLACYQNTIYQGPPTLCSSLCYLACCQNTMYQGPPTPSVIQLVVRTSCIKGLPLPVLFSLLSEHHVSRGLPLPVLFSLLSEHHVSRASHSLQLPVLFSLLSEHHVSRASHSQCYLACCQNTMY